MTIIDRQSALDTQKWLKSEELGRDACGEFDYCKYCDKAIDNPCAVALGKMESEINSKITTKKEESKTSQKKCTKKTTKTTTKTAKAKSTTSKTKKSSSK